MILVACGMQFPIPGSKVIVQCVDNTIYLWDIINKSTLSRYMLPSTSKEDCHCDVTSSGKLLLCVRIWFRFNMPGSFIT